MSDTAVAPRIPWLVLILAGIALFILLSLGTWQVKRLAWKEGLLATIDVPESGGIIRNNLNPGPEGHRGQTEIARISGHWSEVLRTAIFTFGPGRPCDYHYHDGDEYWFVFRGHFTLKYQGEDVPFRPGMILAAGMGEEHGVVDPDETFEGIGFATQLEGEGRDGHLWRNVHGDPVPTRGA